MTMSQQAALHSQALPRRGAATLPRRAASQVCAAAPRRGASGKAQQQQQPTFPNVPAQTERSSAPPAAAAAPVAPASFFSAFEKIQLAAGPEDEAPSQPAAASLGEDDAGEGFDFAVRVGDLPDSSLVSVRISIPRSWKTRSGESMRSRRTHSALSREASPKAATS
jgi:hypothetical protein